MISNRSTSPALQPVFASSFCIAKTGAVVNRFGSCEWRLCATTRAIGARPRLAASAAVVSTSAEPPSEIELEFAAVIVPSLAKAALSCGILSGRAESGCSSVSTTVSPLRPLMVTGTISSLNRPFSIAFTARVSDWIA